MFYLQENQNLKQVSQLIFKKSHYYSNFLIQNTLWTFSYSMLVNCNIFVFCLELSFLRFTSCHLTTVIIVQVRHWKGVSISLYVWLLYIAHFIFLRVHSFVLYLPLSISSKALASHLFTVVATDSRQCCSHVTLSFCSIYRNEMLFSFRFISM